MKKNNKKGFTLVELLAVIVILALLATAAFTLVIPRVKKARRDVFITEAAGMIDAAETYFVEKGGDCVSIQKLITDQYIGVKGSSNSYVGYVTKDTNSKFKINFNNGSWRTNGEIETSKLTTSAEINSTDFISVSNGTNATVTFPANCAQ